MKERVINQMEPWYGEEERRAVDEYLKNGGWIMEFRKTRELEKMIAEYTGARFCSILPNGTLTLWAALVMAGIGRDDEVIVPDYTMVATPNAVKLAGARPVFVDIDAKNLCLDLSLTEKAITPKTKAIMLVSINGRCPQIGQFVELAKKHSIPLIEDAAQSFGSRVAGKHLGTFGTFGSFSFSVPKVITMGQGGALVTDDEKLYNKLQKFKDFGRSASGADNYETIGYNLKFTDLQAVFGIEQMKKVAFRVERKKAIYADYRKRLSGIREIGFISTDLNDTSPWFIDIMVPDPEGLISHLKEKKIGARHMYPPLHSLPFYAYPGKFPAAISVAEHGVWLPSASNLSSEDIEYICEVCGGYFKK
jgi:perosamine synthetase